jgi:quinol monooxygenase YgiN
MVKVVADNYIKAEMADEFIVLAKQLVQDTRKYDAGCIRYELLRDIKSPQHLIMLEEWEDQESLTKHSESKHFIEAVSKFEEYMENPGDIHLYETLA